MKAGFKLRRARHLRLGQRGERIARKLVRRKKMDMLACNYRSHNGEIDIVARDGAILVFIEVKTRWHTTKSRPSQGLTRRQQTRIYRSAMTYLREIERPRVVCRFDLVEVILSPFGVKELRQWENHFDGERLGLRRLS